MLVDGDVGDELGALLAVDDDGILKLKWIIITTHLLSTNKQRELLSRMQVMQVCLFCCFTFQSTALVMAERSVPLTTLFPEPFTSTSYTYFRL